MKLSIAVPLVLGAAIGGATVTIAMVSLFGSPDTQALSLLTVVLGALATANVWIAIWLRARSESRSRG